MEECFDPCLLPEYKVQQRESFVPGRPQGLTRLFVYYYSVEEEYNQEYVLFDFNAIVAAVGGSMGLFLGFSFLECALAAQRFIQAKWLLWSALIRQKEKEKEKGNKKKKENLTQIKFVKHFPVSRVTHSLH